jgi:hypothetical protein
MTDIRELLREATSEVELTEVDPIDQVRRAVTRRRRAWGATIAVAAAVAAVVVVPLSLSSTQSFTTTGGIRPLPSQQELLETWAGGDGDAAAGYGSIWALACCDRVTGKSWVDRLDPATGKRLQRIAVPTPTSRIAVGAGHVWVIGANAGGGGPSSISMIDPATNTAFVALRTTDPKADPYGIAFADGAAWVTMPDLDAVWRLNPANAGGWSPSGFPGFVRLAIHISGAPWTIAATANGTLWVQRLDSNLLSRIDPQAEPGHIGKTVHWSSRIFGPDGDSGLLAANASGNVGELIPSELDQCDACAQADGLSTGGPALAAIRTSRGFFVTTDRRVYFFDNASLLGGGQPTASIAAQGRSLTHDGQGVVIGTDSGLVHWIPAS